MVIREEILPGALWIYQKKGGVRPGTDAVLLSAFARPKEGEKVLEIGSGSGAIALILAKRFGAQVTAVEIQEEYAELAKRSVEENQLSQRVQVRCEDIRQSTLEKESFSLIVSNPPFYETSGKISPKPDRAIARSEMTLTCAQLIQSIGHHLCMGGRAALIYLARREEELLHALTQAGLYPRRIVRIRRRENEAPLRILVEAVKGVRQGMTEEELILRSGMEESSELRDYYRMLGIEGKK